LGVIFIRAASSSTGIAAGIVAFLFWVISTLRKINRNFRFSQNKVALDALRAQVVAELAAQQPEAVPKWHHPEVVQEELRRRPC
jgi:ABC-type phosphate/phosphonate transport system permease subunit